MGNLSAQQIDLTLDEAIELAREKSFEAFRAKNMYLDKALSYENYLKLLYPKATLSITPSNYNRSIEEQWDSDEEQLIPYEQQRLTSSGNLSLTQFIKQTGGTLSLRSYLNRAMTFKEAEDDYTTYISNPITLTYKQSFSSINTFKWRAKIDPIQFKQAQKTYVEDVEAITLKTISLFFGYVNAQMNYRIAELNKNNADTLFLFGEKKLDIGAITRDNYLKLQLKQVNAGIALESRLLAKKEALYKLNNFLELPRNTELECNTPSRVPLIEIKAIDAINKVFQNNPDMIGLKNKLLVAERGVKTAKAKRLSADFSTTIGLNQHQANLADAYRDLKDQQSINFTLSVPIVDWGDTKRGIMQAKLNEDLVKESARKDRDAIELDVLNMVNEFNIKHKQVLAAAQADSISQIAYEAVKQQYMLGKASVLDINTSYTDMQSAQNSYLNSLNNFWTQFYSIRKLCLYDFEKGVDLNANFEKMMEEY